jgi:glucosylceramidase
MKRIRNFQKLAGSFLAILLIAGCSDLSLQPQDRAPVDDRNLSAASITTTPGVVTQFVTHGDKTALFQQLAATPAFTTTTNNNQTIELNTATTYQAMDGFGYTLTQASAYVLMTQMTSTQRSTILSELFDATNGIGVSFIRIGIGATDLSTAVYTYDDLPAGQTDVSMANFSLNGPDLTYLVPVLKQMLAIAPGVKIIATPWTAPTWMKSNGSFIGGSLNPVYYDAYATYFVKYIQGMQGNGIPIYAVTPQNEPENPNNNPSMTMTATEQTNFIMKLGPALQNAGLATKIIVFDHNCDHPDYPTSVLNGSARPYTDGAAFHLYAGNISALTTVKNNTGKNVYFTEQYTGSGGSFVGDLGWHMQNVMIGATSNWAKTALEWNLATNSTYGPATPGGCTTCLGALTVASNGAVTRNVSYYIVAQMSKLIRPGALRVQTTATGTRDLSFVGFTNDSANGSSKVLVVYNNSQRDQTFNIRFAGKIATVTLHKKSVGSYIWY